MKTYEKKGWYALTLPDGWEVDEAEEPVSIYHSEGAGALQITAEAPRPLAPGQKVDVLLMLRSFLARDGVDAGKARHTKDRGFDWAICEYTEDSKEEGKLLWRVWMVTNHDLVVFLTYACSEEDRDLERADIDGIVSSLTLR